MDKRVKLIFIGLFTIVLVCILLFRVDNNKINRASLENFYMLTNWLILLVICLFIFVIPLVLELLPCMQGRPVVNSGLGFYVFSCLLGWLVRNACKKINNVTGNKVNDIERDMNIVISISCIILMLIAFFIKADRIGLIYFALLLGRFVWLDSTIDKVIPDIREFVKGSTFIERAGIINIGMLFGAMCLNRVESSISLAVVIGTALGDVIYMGYIQNLKNK